MINTLGLVNMLESWFKYHPNQHVALRQTGVNKQKKESDPLENTRTQRESCRGNSELWN